MTVPTPPRARPAAAIVAALIAVGLIALGAVGIHDLLADQGAIESRSWTRGLLDGLDGLTANPAVVLGAVLAVLVGLWLLWISLRPGRRTHLRAPTTDADLWVSRGALAALARERAERIAAVTSADARARRSGIQLNARTNQSGELTGTIAEAVNTHLDGLAPGPVKVRTSRVR
jgi:Family of unknown function (DUF6286)